MPHPIEFSVLRIFNSDEETVGTGFLVAPQLAVTCAHVARDALNAVDSVAGETLRVRFNGQTRILDALVLPEFWRDIDQQDIAILQLNEVPEDVLPLPMERAATAQLESPLYTFGYARAAGEDQLGGSGIFITLAQESKVFQFRMHEAGHGHSGAPVWDVRRGVVIGIIQKGNSGPKGKLSDTAFAIPTETIWDICPQLKPAVPVLPTRNQLLEGIHLLPYDYDQRIQNFLNEYLGNENSPVPFGGREDILRKLDRWLANETPYLLLAAPAGRGKSALFVRWLDLLSARKDLSLAFVPISIRFGTNMERVFYASLAARLAKLHGDDVPVSTETSTAVYQGLVRSYLGKPLPNGRTLLVVLDGLDEAADFRPGADFLPNQLPSKIKIAISSRFLAGDKDAIPWLRRLNLERSGLAETPELLPLDPAGVANVLVRMGCPLDELSRNVDIVKELHRLSEGDPLLVSLYVGDLWSKGQEVTRLKPEDLVGLKAGYEGYFDRWWDDQRKLWDRAKPWLEEHVRSIKNLLSGALGGLLRDELQALAPDIESEFIIDAVDILQRFVIGDGVVQGYTFSHPKLGQYFWESMTELQRRKVEGCFLEWGEQILNDLVTGARNAEKKTDVPAYVIRNYGAHLVKARQPIDKFIPLIENPQWSRAWFAYEGAYGGFLQDTRRVWEKCMEGNRISLAATGKAQYVTKEIHCALIEVSLHTLIASISPELLLGLVTNRIWTVPQSLVFIRQMSDERQKAGTILAILPYASALEISEIWDIVLGIRSKRECSRALSGLLPYLPDSSLGMVNDLVRKFDATDRPDILPLLATRMPQWFLDQIRSHQSYLKSQSEISFVLGEVAQKLPELTLELLISTKVLRAEIEFSFVLRRIAEHISQPRLGEVHAAARTLKAPRWQADVLVQIARRKPEAWQETLNAMEKAANEPAFPEILKAVAPLVPELLLDKVVLLGESIKDPKQKTSVLIEVGKRRASVWEKALDAAEEIQPEGALSSTLCEVVEHLPDSSLIERPYQIAKKMEESYNRFAVLIQVARHKTGVWEEMLNELAEKDSLYHGSLLGKVSESIPEDYFETVYAIIEKFHGPGNRAIRLARIAKRKPDAWTLVVRDLNSTQFLSSLGLDMAEINRYLSEAAPIEDLLSIARRIPFEDSRYQVMRELAQYKPELWNEILLIAIKIGDQGHCYRVKDELAFQIPEKLPREALGGTEHIVDDWKRAQVLNGLALRLPADILHDLYQGIGQMGLHEYRALVYLELGRRAPEFYAEELDRAAKIKNEWERSEVIRYLVPEIPEHLLEKAMIMARGLRDEWARSNALMGWASQKRDLIVREALHAVRSIRDEWARSVVLNEFAQIQRGQASIWVLDAILELREDWILAGILQNLVKYLPVDLHSRLAEAGRQMKDVHARSVVLCALARRNPESYFLEFLAATRKLGNDVQRASLLLQIIDLHPELFSTLLGLAKRIRDGHERARLFCILAERLPVAYYDEIAASLGGMEADKQERVLKALAQRRPEFMPEDRYAAMQTEEKNASSIVMRSFEDLLGTAQRTMNRVSEPDMDFLPEDHTGTVPKDDFQDEEDELPAPAADEPFEQIGGSPATSPSALSDSAQAKLPPSLHEKFNLMISDSMNPGQKIEEMRDLAIVLRSLTKSHGLQKLPTQMLYRFISEYLSYACSFHRREFLFYLESLIPLVRMTTSEDVESSIYHAVNDISERWP